jgi:hypothetical protein
MEAQIKRRCSNFKQLGSFSGASNFRRRAKASLTAAKKSLHKIPTYTLHHPARKHLPWRRVFVSGMHEQYTMDLQKISNFNSKKRYLLVVIHAFSRRPRIEANPNKTCVAVTVAFGTIMRWTGGVPMKIHVDEGTEFLNKDMYLFLEKKGIDLFRTYSSLKGVIVERFIRTLFGIIQVT